MANVQFTRDNLISQIGSLKRKWKAEKKEKNTTGSIHGFGLINVTGHGVKHHKLKEAKV